MLSRRPKRNDLSISTLIILVTPPFCSCHFSWPTVLVFKNLVPRSCATTRSSIVLHMIHLHSAVNRH